MMNYHDVTSQTGYWNIITDRSGYCLWCNRSQTGSEVSSRVGMLPVCDYSHHRRNKSILL